MIFTSAGCNSSTRANIEMKRWFGDSIPPLWFTKKCTNLCRVAQGRARKYLSKLSIRKKIIIYFLANVIHSHYTHIFSANNSILASLYVYTHEGRKWLLIYIYAKSIFNFFGEMRTRLQLTRMCFNVDWPTIRYDVMRWV